MISVPVIEPYYIAGKDGEPVRVRFLDRRTGSTEFPIYLSDDDIWTMAA